MLTRRILFSLASILATALIYANVYKLKDEESIVENPNATQEIVENNFTRATTKNAIQVALLLDTSGSMQGLIEQAKTQLWNIVNALTDIKRGGEEVDLEIALYEYGNPSKTYDSNQIHQLSGFTTDMDDISELLFALNTNGGEEYCGAVIKSSLKELDWRIDNSLKMLYIAGNEGFDQGPVAYQEVCEEAKKMNISVNTIYCSDGRSNDWKLWNEGAKMGGGEYVSIDHNQKTQFIATPYDQDISRLNTELNNTYVPIGDIGHTKILKQKKQDDNAGSYGISNVANRAKFKSSKKYKTETWDLISSYEKDKSILSKKTELPDSLSTLSTELLEEKILSLKRQREQIQNDIQGLGKKRDEYIRERKTTKTDLQNSILKSVQRQVVKKGYTKN